MSSDDETPASVPTIVPTKPTLKANPKITNKVTNIRIDLCISKELEVLFFSLHNWSSSDISNALELVNGQVVSKNTIANIKRNIMTKMECFNLNDMAHKSYICGYNLILPEELVFNHIH